MTGAATDALDVTATLRAAVETARLVEKISARIFEIRAQLAHSQRLVTESQRLLAQVRGAGL